MIVNITIEKSGKNQINFPVISDEEAEELLPAMTRALMTLVKDNIQRSCEMKLDISDSEAMEFMELSLNKGQIDDESFHRVMGFWLTKLMRKYEGNLVHEN